MDPTFHQAAASMLKARWRRAALLIGAALVTLPCFFMPKLVLPGPTYRWLIVIDITESMNVRDIAGRGPEHSRLDAAKQSVVAALRALPCGSQVAIALFAGVDTLNLFEPLEVCSHFDAMEQVVSRLDWRMGWIGDSRIENGLTHAIGEAARMKLNLLFVTDGDETPRRSAARLTGLQALRGRIKGTLVGVGGESLQPVPRLDEDNQIVGYWQAADAVREGFHPNNVAALTGLEAGVASPGGGLDDVDEHLSAMRGRYLMELGTAAGFDFVHARSPSEFATTATRPAAADISHAPRDVRPLFALLAALLVVLDRLLGANRRR